EVDVALTVQRDVLGPMRADMREPHRLETRGEARTRLGIDRELDELDPAAHRRRGRAEWTRRARSFAGELLLEQQQRAHAVDRGRARRRGTELVVEDLERDRPRIAARQHVAGKARHRHATLPWEA